MSTDPRVHYDSVIRAGMSEASQRPEDTPFDIFEWYPRYQSCQRYFLDHAQHTVPVQALSSFLNIHLPFQRQPTPVFNSAVDATLSSPPGGLPAGASVAPSVSMVPYIRRLVATGMDYPGVLHGFFGDDWASGIGSLHEQERRNFFFAAKSGGWAAVKKDYDILPLETVPFLRPLQGSENAEIEAAEKSWNNLIKDSFALKPFRCLGYFTLPMERLSSSVPGQKIKPQWLLGFCTKLDM
ncbi:conserved hypothetical protein [Microsporum canis CBS 113480]|uniref:Ilp is an apoptosis inhibitor n=1 Tax=Arthroderma otae (strain ATCC MYA-4605 / CBS 113480) TaxID=554155 RepID=C5FF34_ARTOC|nr:conserved hypothetical protein [Microsporum canis CBS 113480]EEQ28418.1 conserved hypothetical protein [Microsporum canis CBS 113480]